MKLAYKVAAAFLIVAVPMPALAAPIEALMYKNPNCSCCETYAAYLEKNGFKVDIKPTNELNQIAARAGVPVNLRGCHTIKIGNYVIEGFVPAEQVKKMLDEKSSIIGLSMPGMPMDIPGMGFDSMPGGEAKTYTTYAFTMDGKAPTVYATYPSN
jgi:hypothetical protein